MIIFGKNIPLVEALFIFMVIIMCILIANVIYLIMMMKELKKLKSTLITERANLYKLETDISSFEAGKYRTKQSKQTAIGQYIQAALKKGYDKNEIRIALTNKGWPKEAVEHELDNAIRHLKKFYQHSKGRPKQNEVRAYIQLAFERGLDKNEIKKELVNRGISPDIVDTELDSAVEHLKKIYTNSKGETE